MDGTSPERTYEDAMKRRQTDPWNFLFIAGMWFQDLFNDDFRRRNVHYSLRHAAGRDFVLRVQHRRGLASDHQNMHKNATVAEWYKNHGKHEIYAKGKAVNLESFEDPPAISTSMQAARVRQPRTPDVPLTAAEEERARRKKAYEEQAKVRDLMKSWCSRSRNRPWCRSVRSLTSSKPSSKLRECE